MNIKYKGIIIGVITSLFITGFIMSLVYIFQDYLTQNLSLSLILIYLIYIGFFVGGVIAIYISKSKKLKDTLLIGIIVGVISFILYWIGIRIILDIIIPMIYNYQSTLPSPQSFLMSEYSYTPTIVDHLVRFWSMILFGLKIIALSLTGGYSYFLFSQIKSEEVLNKKVILPYILLMIILLLMIFSSNYYLLSGLGLIFIILIVTVFVLIKQKMLIK